MSYQSGAPPNVPVAPADIWSVKVQDQPECGDGSYTPFLDEADEAQRKANLDRARGSL